MGDLAILQNLVNHRHLNGFVVEIQRYFRDTGTYLVLFLDGHVRRVRSEYLHALPPD
jgi:hypothetical protein